MQRYEKYKDSGIEWLSKIPEHWELNRLKYIFREKKKVLNFSLPAGSISFGEVVFKDDDRIPESTKATYQEVLKGDYLINPLNLNYDLISLRIALSDINVVVSSGYIVIQDVIQLNKNYYKWLLHQYDISYMKLLGSGVRQTISFNNIANSGLPYPNLDEQEVIAQFLDVKCKKIDAAVKLKEQQIEKLKELRQITIHNAVTKGISHFTGKTVTMKDSGIDWIGEIPEHWEVKPLRYLGTTQNGLSKGGEFFGHGTPFVSYSDVYKNEEIPSSVNGLVKIEHEEMQQYSVLEGDIFFTRTSETVEEIGLSAVATFTYDMASFAGFLIRFRPTKDTLSSLFSKYYFRSQTHRSYFVGNINLVIRASLSQELLKGLPVLLPPLSEQEEIAAYLEEQTSKIDKAIAQKQEQIVKLKEYKQSLINEVVTGKLKVVD